MQQNPVPTLGKLLLLACVLVLLLLACELDPPMFSFSYDANGAQSGDLPAPVSLHKGGSTITVAGNTGNLIKPNFSFNYWNTKQDGSGKAYLPGDTFTLAREDVVLYAQWNPNPSYKTTYYRQNADNDDYTLYETENLSGAVNTAAISVHKIYAGFTENTTHPNTLASGTILADGSLVLKLYYDRNTFTVSFQTNSTATISDLTNQKYGAKIAKPNDPTRQGYTFSGWYKEASLSNPWDFLADTITENTTLYAKWGASNTTSYTVEHYTQDLNLSTYSKAELETLSGPTATVVNATYKTYPGFTKDESNANTQISGTIAGDGSLVLRLYYTRNIYTVSFQTNSTATISDLTNQPYGATMAKPTAPTKQGYSFAGWYKETELTTAWNFTNDTIQTYTTLYAKWSPNTTTPYTVKYYLQDTDGSTYTLQESVAKTGTTATTGTSEAKTYSGFTENTTKSERLTEAAILSDGSLVLKRYYDRNTYTLTFDANGGSGTQVTQDLKYQTSTQLTANSYTRAGYSFAGWNTQANGTGTNYTDKASYSIGAGTVTLYAQWTAKTYTVTFDEQGGTTPNPTSKTVTYDSTYGDLATTLRSGYTFTGWYTQMSDGTKIENTTTVSTQADHTLYAHWTVDSYAITYTLSGGTNAVSNPDSYTIQTPTVTLAVPTKTNYTFGGWYTSSTFSGSPVTSIDQGSTGTKAFYAKWTLNSYSVIFNANGGSGSMSSQAIPYNTQAMLDANAFTRTGYAFTAWNTQANGLGSSYTDQVYFTMGGTDTTLYAQWAPRSYTVTFDEQGGTTPNPTSKTVTYASTYGSLATTSKDGYTFAGWYTQKSDGTKIENTTSVSTADNHTLYARWTAKTTTAYKTEHYKQNLINDDYTLFETENLSGVTDTIATAVYKTYTGFTKDESNASTQKSGTIEGDGSLVLKLYYTRNTYTVSFASNGGSSVSDLTNQKYEAKVIKPNDPTKQGYSFAGWYKEAALTTAWDFTNDTIQTNTSLYANWSPNTTTPYTVNYYLQDTNGSTYTLQESVAKTGTTATTGTSEAKTYSGFTENTTKSERLTEAAILSDGSLVLKRYYDRNTYRLTFDANGGSGTQVTQDLKYQTSTALTANSYTRIGYSFAGWNTQANGTGTNYGDKANYSIGAGTVTLYAQWTAKTYTVTFDKQGGTTPVPTTKTVTYDSTYVSLATTSRDGYTLSGWYTASSGGTKIETTSTVATASNHLLYARWTAKTTTAYKTEHYKQNLNDAGYTLFETENLSGVTDTVATAVYKTYTGFTKDESNASTVASGTIAGNGSLVLKLYYTRNTYTVSFASNGGSSVSDLINQKYEAKVIKPNNPTKQGYSFSGWYKEAALTTAWDFASDTVEADTTLYAKWTADSYSITYTLNGGTNASSNPATYTIETPTITLAEPTKPNYTFDGWYASSAFSGSPVTSILNGSTGVKAFYAKWTPTSYTITYDLDGGTNAALNPGSYTIATPSITLDDPTKTHYDFWGWYETSSFSGTPITTIAAGSSGAKTLYAKWLPTYYLVIFKPNGGSSFMDDQSIRYTYQATLDANAFTLTGYSFTGWNTQADGSGTSYADEASITMGSEHLTLYAQWAANTYTVSFDGQRGAVPDPTTKRVTFGSSYGELPTTSRTGYTFAGWYTAASGGDKVESITTVSTSSNHTLYAHWTVIIYTVTFDAQSGTTPSPLIKFVTYNSTYGTLAITNRTGYTFAGWYTATSGGDKVESTTAVTTSSSHTLYAQWTAKSYAVTFDGQGGSAPNPSSKQVTFGSAYGSFATSSRDGYTLAGWYHSSIGSSSLFTESSLVALAEDHTLLAHWDAITYDIAYTLNGGTNSQDNPAHYSIESETITLAAPTRDGYDFVGWYADVNLSIPQPLIPKGSMGNKTLYAKWAVAFYSVSYELNSGTNAPGNPTVYTILENTITLLNPTRSHYTFGGWYTTSEFTGTAVTSIPSGSFGDKTFYAKWVPDSYTITYVLDGGTNASSNPPSYTIETPTITLATPTKLHYDFGGWYAASDFSESAITTIPTGSTGDITLHAKWTLTNYHVIFNANGGSGTMASQAIPYNTQANLTANVFTRTGYSFTGWNTQANGLGTSYADKALYTIGGADVNLYAQWQKNTYTLTFNKNLGTGDTVTQNLLYATSTPLTANTYIRTGYNFDGWNTQSNGLGTSYADKANYSIGAANATLYAKWKPLNISITFDEEGGTTTDPVTIYRDYNTAYDTLPTTTRTGYTFAGWWTGDNGTGTQVISTTTVTATNWHYLYAKWTPNTNTAYKVEHYQQDVSGSGYTLFETENKTGTTATQVTATAKTYADFNYNNSLSPASGTIAANGSLVLKLYYDRKTYTVTFQSNGGSAVTAYTGIRHGATISAPADPTRSGYVFNLWYADSNLTQRFEFATQTITANTTLYAKWWSGGVGDLGPAGGVVFHDKGVYSDGWRYLEAASTDVVDAYHKGETTYEWGGKTTYLYHINYTLIGTSLAIGTGEANSLAMIAALSNYSYIYSGADLCREVYRQGGYSDWFLPSVLELDKMARLTDAKAGAFTILSGVYWSSSESSSSNAYLYASAGKSYSPMPKESLFRLRAARAF